MNEAFVTGILENPVGKIKQVSTIWSAEDIWSTIKVRWSIGRMNYRLRPGLYAIGSPGPDSDIYVTGNFKLSFDHLRRALHSMNAWILVLDTKGINVWCAAGKGTFGTNELVYRIKAHKLDLLVTHRKVIVPQLGAVGVAAHEVKHRTGFRVIYGPVEAKNIKSFVEAGYRATPEMRKIKFTTLDRLKLIPVDLSYGGYYLIFIPALFFILSGLSTHGYSVDTAWQKGGFSVINLLAAYLSGIFITPLLLPWIPFRRFSLKGLLTGILTAFILFNLDFLGTQIVEIISWFLIICAVSSFLAMNFTGSSTYTSLSGVKKEMKFSFPLQIASASLGLIGWIITKFI